MSDSLIERVRKCAEAQKKADLSAGKAAHDLTEVDAAALDKYWEEVVKLEFPALLAHLERTQAVEAERDADEKLIADLVVGMDSWAAQEDHEIYADAWPAYCNARARLVWEFADQKPSGTPPKVPKLSALRAELQRKDAALRKAEQALFDHVAIEGDQASFALRAVRAALQPKEPPCPTA